ncbi:MAG: CDP-archaeol synthase [Muribaculaceae bacterium]|nr:CDP-archaeol synthase [Muribaculaceae bacterium]
MKKLLTRTITGSLFVALIVLSLIATSSTLYLCVFTLLTILGLTEFYRLTIPEEKNLTKIIDVLGGIAMFGGLYARYQYNIESLVWLTPYILYIIIRQIAQLYTHEISPLSNMAYSLMGQLYVALPLALINILYYRIGAPIVLVLFIFIWLNDTGAFCVGSLIGKNKLFERISPKKSWEGFFGGLFFVIVASIIISLYFDESIGTRMDIAEWIGLGVAVSLSATWGDLSESLIKRTLKVKDSGKLLPGHGGILDRIDSLLLVIPASIAYLLIISNI